jgi:BON domain
MGSLVVRGTYRRIWSSGPASALGTVCRAHRSPARHGAQGLREDAQVALVRAPAKHIHVAIADGKVILSGRVPTWGERFAAEQAVRGTPGVREVDNQVHIES